MCMLVGETPAPTRAAPAQVPLATLTGHVEDDLTLELKDSNGEVLNEFHGLTAGTYTVAIDVNAFAHNPHLLGAPVTECTGENACQTPVNDIGQYTWTVTFQPSQNAQDLVT